MSQHSIQRQQNASEVPSQFKDMLVNKLNRGNYSLSTIPNAYSALSIDKNSYSKVSLVPS